MAILVKNINKPSKCAYCFAGCYSFENGRLVCNAKNEVVAEIPYEDRLLDGSLDNIEVPDWCPIVEIPQGRLGDLDYVIELLQENAEEYSEVDENGLHSDKWCGYMECIEALKKTPVIIEN